MQLSELERRFRYHEPTEDSRWRYEAIRGEPACDEQQGLATVDRCGAAGREPCGGGER